MDGINRKADIPELTQRNSTKESTASWCCITSYWFDLLPEQITLIALTAFTKTSSVYTESKHNNYYYGFMTNYVENSMYLDMNGKYEIDRYKSACIITVVEGEGTKFGEGVPVIIRLFQSLRVINSLFPKRFRKNILSNLKTKASLCVFEVSIFHIVA